MAVAAEAGIQNNIAVIGAGDKKNVAVIGAGIAGLCCATALQAAGYRVSVFEKSRGAGGRMSTRRGGGEQATGILTPTWHCDHGAPWFDAGSAAFQAEVARWCNAGVAAAWSPLMPVTNATAATSNIATISNVAATSNIAATTTTATTATTAAVGARFIGVPHMTSPAAFLAGSLKLTCQTTIVGFERHGNHWQLLSAERGLLADHFDAVLLAIPAPQAAPLLSRAAAELSEPTVSCNVLAMAAIAAATTMRATWVLMLQFDSPATMPFDARACGEGPLQLVVHNSAKPGRFGLDSWVIHASPNWSEAHLEEPSEVVVVALLAAFKALGGPDPQSWTAHRWRYAATDFTTATGAVWDENAQLGLCGDWMNGGTVEAAWQSGQQLARQMMGQSKSSSEKP